ncbi:uncharacterized protein [Misgurnus anguillicaudatus]|uniref:uncharacterized protein n=1 Tax=Misgurnus anguillicaudatus TaxID=75329 RepID=UPI003CCF86C7
MNYEDAHDSVTSEVSSSDGAAAPQTPAVPEEACPEEKAMDEDEDFEEGGSKSSSHHELSSESGTGSDISSLTKGSSSVLDDCSDVEPLSIQPAPLSLPCVGRVPRAGMKLPAPVEEGSPLWSDLSDTVDHNASLEESTPPSAEAAGTHQEDAHGSVRSDSDVSPADGAAAPQTPAVPEEAYPEEKAVVEDEDFEEGGSKSSSHHELSSESGTGSDISSLAKG